MKTNRSIRWLIFAVLMFSLSAAAFSQIAVGISVRFGPPAIPVYAQPICPGPGYIWTPGYWAWDDDGGYYWVPGTWVLAPVGMYWTPGYWGWYDGFYRWHSGYWGPHVGFYGGINYGYGYTGDGFYGGEWRGGRLFYNRSVTNVNVVNVTNVYNRTVIVHNNTRVSYNGGSGGVNRRPTRDEERWSREPHREALADQREHERSARQDRALFASQNHGRPAIAATGRPGDFRGREVVAAREAGGKYRAPNISPREARGPSLENRSSEARNENRRDVARPANRDTARPANRDVTRPGDRETARPAHRDVTRPADREVARPANRETARPANREMARPARPDMSRPANREAARPANPDVRTQTRQDRGEQRPQQQQMRQEQIQRQPQARQEQRPRPQEQRVQQPRAEPRQAPQNQKRQQREEPKREGRGPGR
jgi:hypothetical protein